MNSTPAAPHTPPGINRREMLFYVFGTALLIALSALVVGLLWYAAPPAERETLGPLDAFPPGSEPHLIITEAGRYYVVNDGEQIVVFDGRTTNTRTRCHLIWVRSNERFEDPCWGTKFTLSGEFIEGPARRHLDRYGYELRDGELVVNRWALTPGAPVEGG